MIKPNFFVIGGRKCGTTSLVEYLKTHPQVFMSEPKELDYFSREELRQEMGMRHLPPMSRQDYLEFFRSAQPWHRVVGEASVSYLTARRAVPLAVEFNPEARFLVMLRNPIDAAQSLHNDLIMHGTESVADFVEAWRLQEERRHGRKVPLKCLTPRVLLYQEMCSWGEQLERVLAVVGKERLHVVLFDDFVRDTRSEYLNVLEFLGLPDDGRNEFPRENPARRYENQTLVNVLDTLDGLARRVKLLLGTRRRLGVGRIMTRIKRSQEGLASRSLLPDDCRREVSAAFRPDVEKLGRLIDRDLNHWLLNNTGRSCPAIVSNPETDQE